MTDSERSNTILSLRGLEKRYGDVCAVDRVDLDIKQGEVLTLLGASGSGKSTILMMVAGFVAPTGGDIVLRDRSIVRQPPHRRGVGVVFQSYALFPHLTVFENVAYGLRTQGRRSADINTRVAAMLELVQLSALADRYPDQLSGGQQQRVSVARALAPGPDILLLDEPLGALDKGLREHMLVELRRIHANLGTTMIFVTHDQGEAMVMSNRIAIMRSGRVVATGTPRDLYADPRTPFVAGFLGEANILSLESLQGQVMVGPSVTAIAVRPERACFTNLEQAAVRFDGIIKEVLYFGDRIKYQILTPNGLLLTAYSNGTPIGDLRAGELVSLGWLAHDICHLEEDPYDDRVGYPSRC